MKQVEFNSIERDSNVELKSIKLLEKLNEESILPAVPLQLRVKFEWFQINLPLWSKVHSQIFILNKSMIRPLSVGPEADFLIVVHESYFHVAPSAAA